MSSIIRVEKTKNYTVMCNYHFKEKKMSLKAKGLLSLMLSLPDDWDYTIAGLVSICKENESAIKSALDELKEFGYLKIIKHLPDETKSGRIEYEYIIYEKPIENKEQAGEKQDLENLGVEFLPLEKPGQLSTKLSNTNKSNSILDKSNIEYGADTKKELKKDIILAENVKCIIDYLNESTNSKFKYENKQTIKDIKARFKEGYVLDDFYDVIDKKVKEWFNTEMEKYLRPSTLFGNKFENYVNQKNNFSGKPKTSYSSKPSFDNTAEHEILKGVAEMTPEERADFEQNELARDENGNLMKF